ncbi:metallophosphoesterase family protein [Pseudotabrizicola alkalilacus]|uniref:Phosphoesterase n=1 Tax=Pseudotabrizicola alkalilacus TaxID=2305252 RepID=A0A411YZS3_9RHOB|nr:metallophosphoesterase [Pseudotabrizicola alkalilacus]RGP36304.1 phosphoesterase [Pseudotabrizicola alkalilacus]
MTLIAQITDPHLRDDGADPCHDPAQAMRQAFAQIAAMDRRPDAIVLTGDIIDRSAADYTAAADLLRAAPVPLLPLSGNHDRPEDFREAFADWADFAPDHLSFTRRIGDAILIALDSNLPDGSGGVDALRLGWLQDALADATGPVILALHHPPFPTGAPHLDKPGFAGAAPLAALVQGSPICRIIAGHSHRAMQTQWAGVTASTCTAIGHGLSLSLTGAYKHKPSCLPPAYEVHLLQAGSVISYQINLESDQAQSCSAPSSTGP